MSARVFFSLMLHLLINIIGKIRNENIYSVAQYSDSENFKTPWFDISIEKHVFILHGYKLF